MATEVILPRLGQGMESGTIVRWLKSEGEPVEKGEPLFELDTDKVTQEVEAEAAGVLLKIAVSEGEVPVGQTVAFIGAAGEACPSVALETPAAPAPELASNESATSEGGARAGADRFREWADQGLAARAPACARTRNRPQQAAWHGAGGTDRRRGRRSRRGRRAGRHPS